jgi:hypothetical protein
MVDSAINLTQKAMNDAGESQAQLEKTLGKLNNALQSANASLAQTSEEKIKRALNEAKSLAEKAQKLSGADQAHDKNADSKDANPDAKKNADAAKAKNQNGKDDDGKNDNNKGDKGEQANSGKEKPAHNGDRNDKKLSADERHQMQAELYNATARLARRLEQDKIADASVRAQLMGATGDQKSFEEMFKDGQKTALDRYLGSVRAVSSHLEDKLTSVLKARRLSATQREQTPAPYRTMVSDYYEQLAKRE